MATNARELRERAVKDVDRQLKLAYWCARAGMPERSKLHYALLLRSDKTDPKTREHARRKLDLQEVDGSLLTTEEIKVRRETAKKINRAIEVEAVTKNETLILE